MVPLASMRIGARVDGMVSISERSINVVTVNKPKTMTGLRQNGTVVGAGSLGLPCHGHTTPPADRADLTHAVSQAEHGKPVIL